MLSFFRRGATEKVMLGVLALSLVAIIITGFGTGGTGGIAELASGGGDTLVKVGDRTVTGKEVTQQIERQVAQAREQQPDITTAQFLAGGGFEQILQQMISQRALVSFGSDQGLAVSKRMIDGEIASIPAFKNLAGDFDQATFQNALAQQRITEQQLRDDIAATLMQQQMYVPIASVAKVPDEMAKQYAALLLERRNGAIGLVPAQAMGAGREPTDAEVAAYFQKNVGRYTIPERRVIRYALFGADSLGDAAKASPAEIEAYYKSNQDKYGPKETRTLSQVVLPSQAAAQAFAAKLAAGTSFADAAKQAGFAAADTSVGEQTKQGLTSLASAAVADAAFALPQGKTTAPLQSPLGWHIVRVDAINRSEGKPLAAVTDEIRQQVEARKAQEALADKVARVEDKIADGASLQEVAKAEALTIAETPAVTAAGTQPGVAGAPPLPELQPILKPAFEMQPEDDAEVQAIVPNQRFAVFEVGKVIPAAPPAMASIQGQVKADFVRERALDRARAVAVSLVAKINAGTPPAKAFAEAGVTLPPLQQVSLRRVEIARQNQPVPPALALLFSLPVGRAQILPAQGQGWFVVTNLSSERGDATGVPGLINATRGQFRQVMGEEYAEQFVHAVQHDMKIRQNGDAIRKLKAQLTGSGTE